MQCMGRAYWRQCIRSMMWLQVQANVTGSREAEDRARAIALLGMEAAGAAKAATARTVVEDDLAVFLAYQQSALGRRAQADLTAASFELVEHIGGISKDSGRLISTVFDRLGELQAKPGLWVLRSPLTEGHFAGITGVQHKPLLGVACVSVNQTCMCECIPDLHVRRFETRSNTTPVM